MMDMDPDEQWLIDYGNQEEALAEKIDQSVGADVSSELGAYVKGATVSWTSGVKYGSLEKQAAPPPSDLHVLVMACSGLVRWHPHTEEGAAFLNRFTRTEPGDDETCGHPVLWRSHSVHTHWVRLNEMDLPAEVRDVIREQLFGGAENPEVPIGHPTVYGIGSLVQLPIMIDAAVIKGLSVYTGLHCDENPECDETCTH